MRERGGERVRVRESERELERVRVRERESESVRESERECSYLPDLQLVANGIRLIAHRQSVFT